MPLAVNLASPVLLGLCISTLRKAAKDLLVDEASPGARCAQAARGRLDRAPRRLPPVALRLRWLWPRRTRHCPPGRTTPSPPTVRGSMTAFELTGIKLWLSAAAALPFAIAFEQCNALDRTPVAASEALRDARPLLWMGIYVGAVWILLFQVNITYLSKLTSAITVGIVSTRAARARST